MEKALKMIVHCCIALKKFSIKVC